MTNTERQVTEIDRELDELLLQLQRAVQDMVGYAEFDTKTQCFLVPNDVFAEVKSRLKAVHDRAAEVVMGIGKPTVRPLQKS